MAWNPETALQKKRGVGTRASGRGGLGKITAERKICFQHEKNPTENKFETW